MIIKPIKRFYLRLFRLFLVLLIGGATISRSYAEVSASPAKRPQLDGTFIQLLDKNSNWNTARWEKLFDSFQAIGLRYVIVQWTLHDNMAYYATRTFEQVPRVPLEIILELAEKRGIDLYLGLAAESQHWEMVRQSFDRQQEYLKRLRWKSERVAQEVAVVATRYKAFKGWYIPEEIDDLTWRSPQLRELLFQHLKQLSGFLKKVSPDGLVLLSGFSNARMNPDSYEAFWNKLLGGTSVDVLLFQDGAGTAKLPLEILPRYLKGLRKTTDANGKKLQVVVELFTMVSESPFEAKPAPFCRVKQQLRIAGEYASDGITSFSVPDYMSAEGGGAAMELLHDYQKYTGGGLSTAP